MKKFMKVVKIILISLLVFVAIGYVILYIVNPEQAKSLMDVVMDYVNRPLPIIGVSLAVFGTLAWKFLSSTIYGKKSLKQMKMQYEVEAVKIKDEYEEKKIEYASIITLYEEELDLFYDALSKICAVSYNKKVKEISENLDKSVKNKREELKDKFKLIVNSDVELLTKSKEELLNGILNLLKKELVEKYGEEGQKAIESISKAEKI